MILYSLSLLLFGILLAIFGALLTSPRLGKLAAWSILLGGNLVWLGIAGFFLIVLL